MTQNHVSDTDLVMAIDGELPVWRQREVGEHVRACWQCRARRAQYERSIEEFITWHTGLPVPPADGPRALFRARLAEASQRAKPQLVRPGRMAYAGLAAVAGCLVAVLAWGNFSGNLSAATPDPNHTPGVTIPVTLKEVCQQEFLDQDRTISPELAQRVFRQYGIKVPGAGHYEVDYLITPALGGAEDVRNMWPQPYSMGVWNAHVKDALEDHLRQLVCTGQLSLAEAQQELSKDWVAAYQRNFHTSRPRAEHATFVKDKPWG
jgi:hypothetical protein